MGNMTVNSVSIDPLVTSVSQGEVWGSFVNLVIKSKEIKSAAKNVYDSDIELKIKIVTTLSVPTPGDSDYAETYHVMEDDVHVIYIEITESVLLEKSFEDISGNEHKYSLERVLSHELIHADNIINNTYSPEEWGIEEAATQAAENSIMEVYGEPHKTYGSIFDSTSPTSVPLIYNPEFFLKEDITGSTDFIIQVDGMFSISFTRGSPLVLDLDGNGIELASLTGTDAVYWDIDQDGFREASGWISGGDGLLAIDKNSDGFISDNGELFGNSVDFGNGFAALAVYDTNNDASITAADAAFSSLLVWVDANQNGYSEADELYSLDDLDITSISLNYTDTNTTNNGNTIKQTSTFVQDGTTRSIVDAWFAYDDVNSTYNGDYTLDVRTLFMPTLRGYGEIADLHIAMSMDNTGTGNLLDMVGTLNAKTFAQIFDASGTLKDDVRDILFKWAGVDAVNPNGRGAFIDGQELAFLEKLMGQEFLQQGMSSKPYGPEAGNDLKEAFVLAFDNFYARLVAQSAGGELFTGDWSYNMVSDTFTGITGLDTDKLDALAANDNKEFVERSTARLMCKRLAA